MSRRISLREMLEKPGLSENYLSQVEKTQGITKKSEETHDES